jgi:hypothetical protein
MNDMTIKVDNKVVHRDSYISGVNTAKTLIEGMRNINTHNQSIQKSCNNMISHLNDIISECLMV